MKIMSLPKGGQHGVHGPVICVPSNVTKTVTSLPHIESSNQIIKAKLKRKLNYKGHYKFQVINKDKLFCALQYLKNNNPYYKDIDINPNW